MTDNNTRTKANAVFFSVLMVISMVAVGFAAVPAAAVATPSITDDAPNNATQGETFDVTYTIDNTGNETGSFALSVADPSAGVTAENFAGDIQSSDPNASPATASTSAIDAGTSGTVTVTYSVSADASTGSVNVVLSAEQGLDNTSDQVTSTVEVQSSSPAVTVQNRDVADANQATIEDVDEGDVLITDGETVFQGEEGIVFIRASDNEVFPASSLAGTSGNREGTPLQMPIPVDEETGTYDANGPTDAPADFSTTVVEPRITTSEVQLNGDDIEQIAAAQADNEGQEFGVQTEYNFDEAENVEITVEDPSGADITAEVLPGSETAVAEDGDDFIPLDMSGEDAGEYTIVFEGADDLDANAAVQQYTFELTNEDSLNVEVGEDPVTQGTDVDFTVSGGTNGNYHLVAIEEGDFRSDDITDNVFRNVEDTEEIGFVDEDGTDTDEITDNTEYAYAIVEIDGTTGVGSIRTSTLDDSSIDLLVYSPEGDGEFYDRDDAGITEEADTDFDVGEGEITLDSPTDTYTVGSEVDINGSASSADAVVVFARDNDDYEPVNVQEGDNDVINTDGSIDNEYIITVDSDDTFEQEDVVLSQANDIYSFEGSYDIGVVDLAELDTSDEGEFSDGELGTSDFSQLSSDGATLQVESGDLTGNFTTVNGQIAQVDNTIDVEGTAAGQDNVVVAFVDERGNTVAQEISVDSDDTFEEDDIGLGDLSQGAVSAHILSQGRDSTIGDGGSLPDLNDDGTAPPATTSGLQTYIEELGTETSSSGDQVRSRIVSNTVEADGSDDLIINANFRLNDATLSIRDVYPEGAQADGVNPVAVGETAVIAGDTNRNSDDSAVSIEILDENGNSVTSTSTEEWGSDGQFSASLNTSDLETGTYIVEADDGESTDRVNLELVDEREDAADGGDGTDGNETDTEEETTEEETTEEETTEEETTEEETTEEETTEENDSEETTEEESTDDSTPGFGALVALVALIAAALLATRRND